MRIILKCMNAQNGVQFQVSDVTLLSMCAKLAEKFMFPLGQTALHCKCQFYVTTVDGRAGGIGIAA